MTGFCTYGGVSCVAPLYHPCTSRALCTSCAACPRNQECTAMHPATHSHRHVSAKRPGGHVAESVKRPRHVRSTRPDPTRPDPFNSGYVGMHRYVGTARDANGCMQGDTR